MSSKQLIAIVAVVSLILASVLTVLFFVNLGDQEQKPEEKKAAERALPKSNFQIVEARPVDDLDRPEAANIANQVSAILANSLNELYTHAFLRPDRWGGGAGTPQPAVVDPQAQLSAFFNAEARPTVPQNIGALALAELGPRFSRVEVTKQEARVSVLIEPNTTSSFAVVSLVFEGRGITKRKAEGPVAIVHNATYWFINDGDALRIYAYNVELKADTVAKTAAFGPADKRIPL